MNTLETNIQRYLTYCKEQKRLDNKTLKAYRIDLTQFNQLVETNEITKLNVEVLEKYIATLHQTFKPKTVKRKIASAKAFFHYLEYKDILQINPFHKMQIRFREPVILPKTIPLSTMEQLLITMYDALENAASTYQKRKTLMDITIVELLFATGIRISELCKLKSSDIDFTTNTIIIFGKGSKERRLQIVNDNVCSIIARYYNCYEKQIISTGYFFSSKSGEALSDQYVRKMINKYSSLAGIAMHITPHMFRHTFATSLLESDVDIRYIQEMLGHSSINITQIYTHVTTAKQNDILKNKHPRKDFRI
ncbi:MAG: tyrosine-type recombinase/integrase [Lachnospiraceae bacterium]|nr:tyrosine-type recombinase/integrase [Lachnospiraceae bacterium]